MPVGEVLSVNALTSYKCYIKKGTSFFSQKLTPGAGKFNMLEFPGLIPFPFTIRLHY